MKQPCYKSYDELPIVLSAKDVAAALCISRSGAYALMGREDFPSIPVGKRILVPKRLFIQWLESSAEKS